MSSLSSEKMFIEGRLQLDYAIKRYNLNKFI